MLQRDWTGGVRGSYTRAAHGVTVIALADVARSFHALIDIISSDPAFAAMASLAPSAEGGERQARNRAAD